MVNRVAERLVHMPFHLRVKADHLADGHGNSSIRLCERSEAI
jgi:hypothetical protein